MAAAASSESEPNYYQVLGVSSRVDPSSLKKAFHHLTKLYHPDKNPQHVERFKEISRAYRVLSDPEKRREYDVKLMRSVQQRQMRDFFARSPPHFPSSSSTLTGDRRPYVPTGAASTAATHHHQQHSFFQPGVGGVMGGQPQQQQQVRQPGVHPQQPGATAGSPGTTGAATASGPRPSAAHQFHHHHYHHHHQIPSWDTSRVQIVRCAVCHGTGTVVRYERLGRGLMREIRVLCMSCSGRGTWCKLYSIKT